MSETTKNKAWTPEQLANHIKEICGPVVAAALEPLNKRVTDYGNWIDGLKSGGVPHAVGRAVMTPEALAKNKGLVFGGILSSLAASRCDLEKAVVHAKGIVSKSRNDEDKSLNEQVVKALEASTGAGGGFPHRAGAERRLHRPADPARDRAVVRHADDQHGQRCHADQQAHRGLDRLLHR